MATSQSSLKAPMLLLFSTCFFLSNLGTIGAKLLGVCYGTMGDNLPPPEEVVSLYRSRNIRRIRLYNSNQAILQALRYSGIEVVVGVPNSELQSIASNPSNANSWVQRNIRNFWPSVRFRYIAVGNEVDPLNGKPLLSAMRNIHNAIVAAGLQDHIRVSTAITTTLITDSFPPSSGIFRTRIRPHIDPIVEFLAQTGSPFLVNIYPYFSYEDNPHQISLPFTLFTAPGMVFLDGKNGYQNLFDGILDALYAALEKSGGGEVEVVVSESGWPSAGGSGATISNARTYNQNLIQHVRGGTPRRPNRTIETYLFSMFDENEKGPEFEKFSGCSLLPSNRSIRSTLIQVGIS